MSDASLDRLRNRIVAREARLAVVGLGYVGLPVACVLAAAGFDVVGLDRKPDRVATIAAGGNPMEADEPGLNELLAEVHRSGRLKVTTDPGRLRAAEVAIICVETPVGPDHVPRLEALGSACENLAPHLHEGTLVIVESTLAPGTMDAVVRPALSRGGGTEGVDFHLGHCPERVMPGRLLRNLRTMSRVVGGADGEVAATMRALYATFVEADLDAADLLTAELVKTAENAYRDVNIAFANELAMICEVVGGDVWTVRRLVNKSPGRSVLVPGGGVGGHCIPKDSWLLVNPLGEAAATSLLAAARRINDGMPGHVARLVASLLAGAGRPPDTPRVCVLGYSYLENSDDVRNSPSAVLVAELESAGCMVAVHDPFVEGLRGDPHQVAGGCDCAVLMVAHYAYRNLDLGRLAGAMRTRLLVDARGLLDVGDLAAAGFRAVRLGGPGAGRVQH